MALHLSLLGALGHRAVTRRATNFVQGGALGLWGAQRPYAQHWHPTKLVWCAAGDAPRPGNSALVREEKNQIKYKHAKRRPKTIGGHACLCWRVGREHSWRGGFQLAGQAASSTSGSSTGAALAAPLAPPAARHTLSVRRAAHNAGHYSRMCTLASPRPWVLLQLVHALLSIYRSRPREPSRGRRQVTHPAAKRAKHASRPAGLSLTRWPPRRRSRCPPPLLLSPPAAAAPGACVGWGGWVCAWVGFGLVYVCWALAWVVWCGGKWDGGILSGAEPLLSASMRCHDATLAWGRKIHKIHKIRHVRSFSSTGLAKLTAIRPTSLHPTCTQH